MLRVDTRFAPAATGPVAAGRRPTGTETFAPAQAEARPSATGTAPTAMLAGLDAILTLQGETAAETGQERRRRTVLRGHELLDGLDRLKAALLGGRVATGELRAIAGRLAERAPSSGDARLDGLMAEIELRAAVELAKIEVARAA